MQFIIIRPRSYNKQHVDIMHVSLLMFSAVKDYVCNTDESSDIQHSTALFNLIHTAVTGTAYVKSGNGFISDHIIPLIQYNTVGMMSI